MKIGIEINGVLRDTIGKFKTVYEKYMTPDNDDIILKTYKLSLSGETTDENTEDSFEYGMINEPTSLDLLSHFKFKSSEELFKFMFEEFPMEIFGHSMSSEINSFNLLNEFYINNRDSHEIYLISDEIGKSKPATLFFLSKFGCLIENIKFYSTTTIDQMWEKIDVLLTANPDLIENHPENTIVVQYVTDYNKSINTKHKIDSLKDFDELINNIEL